MNNRACGSLLYVLLACVFSLTPLAAQNQPGATAGADGAGTPADAGTELPVLALVPAGDGLWRLDGDWLLNGIAPADAQVPAVSKAGAEAFLSSPAWKESTHNSFGAYRLRARVLLPPELQNQALAIYMSEVKLAARFTVHSGTGPDATYSMGKFDTGPEQYRGLEVPVEIPFQTGTTAVDFDFEISNFDAREGGITEAVLIGKLDKIQGHGNNVFLLDALVAGGLALAAVYHFFLFMLRRKDFSPLIFAVICLLYAVRSSISTNFLAEIAYQMGIDWRWSKAIIEYIPDFTLAFWFMLFIRSIFPAFTPRWVKPAAIAGIVSFTLFMLITPNTVYGATPVFVTGYSVVLFTVVLCCIIGLRAHRAGENGARLTVAGVILLGVSGVLDILTGENVITIPHLAPLGLLSFVAVQSLVLSVRYESAFRRIAQLSEKLEDSNRLKDHIIANTSHELRTPLNAIIGISDILRNNASLDLDGDTLEALGMIRRSGNRLLHLVNDMLVLSTLRDKQIRIRRVPVHVAPLIQSVGLMLGPLAREKKLELITQVDPQAKLVMADPDRLEQILINLCNNAIKFTRKGQIRLTAATGSDAHGNATVRFEVRDTGEGIPADKREQIFERFVQIDGSATRKQEGLGLGLSIVKEILELHDSAIELESEPGKGSSFSFMIAVAEQPAATAPAMEPSDFPGEATQDRGSDTPEFLHRLIDAEPRADGLGEHATQTVALAGHEVLPGAEARDAVKIIRYKEQHLHPGVENDAAKKSKLLLVDDDAGNLAVLEGYLKYGNYEMTRCGGGDEVFALLDQGYLPDLVLLDVMMPDLSGYDVCHRLRVKYPAHRLPIIMVTAKTTVQDLVLGFSSGASDYITKPILNLELQKRVESHLTLAKVNKAIDRFVPAEILGLLERNVIEEVRLGDHRGQDLTVLFADIRGFSKLSEQIGPVASFDFINQFLGTAGPLIREAGGVVDKYLGDGILALFPGEASESVLLSSRVALSLQGMIQAMTPVIDGKPISMPRIGVGFCHGQVMLGTIGEIQRMDTTVISDTVNLASRLESLTKQTGASILITAKDAVRLEASLELRCLGHVKIRGREKAEMVYEIVDGRPEAEATVLKTQAELWAGALDSFQRGEREEARRLFGRYLEAAAFDPVAKAYLNALSGSAADGGYDRTIAF